MGKYVNVALGLLAWILLGVLMSGCTYKTTQTLGERATSVVQASLDLRTVPGATPVIPATPKSSASERSGARGKAKVEPQAPQRADKPNRAPSRTAKPQVRSRTVDILVWPHLREIRISSPALRDARFRSRLVRLLEDTRGVASARAGGSPAGVSIYVRLSTKRPDPSPALELILHQIKARLGKDFNVRLVPVDRWDKPLPIGCGCPLPPTS